MLAERAVFPSAVCGQIGKNSIQKKEINGNQTLYILPGAEQKQDKR
jgi:hypothetical protein